MGFLIWALLTAIALAAGGALAMRVGRHMHTGERLVAGCVTAVAIVLFAIQALGYLGLLYPWAVAVAVIGLSVGILAWCRPNRSDLGMSVRRLRNAARAALASPVSIALTAVAALLVIYLAAYAILLPSWGWDALWYHDPITAYAYQQHSLGWVDTYIPFINSYPKNIELLALWNGLFTPDDRLIDLTQLPLVLVGVAALTALCQRAGAEARLAWGLGLVWLFMPAVFLNTPTNYVDAGAASLWLAAVLFLCRTDAGIEHRLFGTLALGAYAGSKVSGLLHTVMLAPIALGVMISEYRRTRAGKRLALQALTAIAGITVLGGATYIRDLIKFGNPFWPAQVPIPLLGGTLPGTWPISNFNTPPFGGPDNLEALWRSFCEQHPTWLVDVRLGGFGLLWVALLLPLALAATLFGLYRLARRAPVPGALAVAVLLVTTVVTPARWWPRYTLGFPAAGLLGAALILHHLPRRWLRELALAAIGAWALFQAWPARTGFFVPRAPEDSFWRIPWQALSMDAAQRNALKFDNWQHTANTIRDRVIQPGEAAIYDDSSSFVYQLWRSDWHNRVLYLPLKGDPREWLAELDRERVRWAQVQRGSFAERTLSRAGWIPVESCAAEGCGIWLRPGTQLPRQP